MPGSPLSLFSFRCLLIVAALMLAARPLLAQTKAVEQLSEAPGFFALPLEFDFDSGAANGNANILRIMPVYTFPMSESWKLVNLTIITVADAPGGTPVFPGSPGSGQTAGVSDLLHGSFLTPKPVGNFIWGAGIMLALPTASSNALGSGKWDAGPAVRVTYRDGPWNLGIVVGQRWSYAGNDERPDVSQLLIRGALRRQLPNDWFLVSAPLITANWKNREQKWLVPVGGGIGRTFRVGNYPWAWSVQGYYNAIKPDAAPDWVFRFGIIAAVPFAGR